MESAGKSASQSGGQSRTPITLRLDQSKSHRFRRFAIIGEYGDGDSTHFVHHVAILRNDTELEHGEVVPVHEMGPPLVAGRESAAQAREAPECQPHLISDLDLDLEEQEAIADWLAVVDREHRPKNLFSQYCIVPHFRWEKDRQSGRRKYRRFNCAGFVLECYRAADIDLIEEPSPLPDVEFDTLVLAYPFLSDVLDKPHISKMLGVAGIGPWKVLLPGYLFHSTERATPEVPRPPGYLPEDSQKASFP